MFQQDWVLAAIAFVVFPIAVLPIARLGRRIRKVTVNTQEEMGAVYCFQSVRRRGDRRAAAARAAAWKNVPTGRARV